MNILIVEDEPLIQRTLKILFERKGHKVEVSSTGQLAIELIKSTDFDRIVCDLMLQDITGFDILEESKNKYNLNEISQKFCIITAYSSEHILEKALNYKCQVYSKPFTDVNLVIDKILRGNNESN